MSDRPQSGRPLAVCSKASADAREESVSVDNRRDVPVSRNGVPSKLNLTILEGPGIILNQLMPAPVSRRRGNPDALRDPLHLSTSDSRQYIAAPEQGTHAAEQRLGRMLMGDDFKLSESRGYGTGRTSSVDPRRG